LTQAACPVTDNAGSLAKYEVVPANLPARKILRVTAKTKLFRRMGQSVPCFGRYPLTQLKAECAFVDKQQCLSAKMYRVREIKKIAFYP